MVGERAGNTVRDELAGGFALDLSRCFFHPQ
eukprot:COSAG06_NODE_6729_length_2807_cov_2.028065_1_plen_31_part_00